MKSKKHGVTRKRVLVFAVFVGLICGISRIVYAENVIHNEDLEAVYRLYNPNSGEHFYTRNKTEKDSLISVGWDDESIAWYLPKAGEVLYRLYNPNSGEHFYTMNALERNHLISVGWNDEKEAFSLYREPVENAVPIYRLFNPNAPGNSPGSHHFTGRKEERDYLVSLGWRDEGVLGYTVDVCVMTQRSDATGYQAMFYTFYTVPTNQLIVIDGGFTGNEEQVRRVINNYGGHVTAWIVTHYHLDHAGAFCEIYANPQGIRIDDVYVSNYDSAYDLFLQTYKAHDNPETFARYMEVTSGGTAENIHHPARGESISVAGLNIKFYNTYDDVLLSWGQSDLPNNSSLVFTIKGSRDSVLFMGDAYLPQLGQYMLDNYKDELQTEFLQPSHHGNSIMPVTVWKSLNPKIMLFDAPEWLMTGDSWKAKSLKAWCDSEGIQTYDFRTAENRFLFY